MISVELKNGVTVRMNSTDYYFPSAHDRGEFMREFSGAVSQDSLLALVARYLDKLQRLVKRVVREVVRLARILADSDNYWRGVGAASTTEVQRYFYF